MRLRTAAGAALIALAIGAALLPSAALPTPDAAGFPASGRGLTLREVRLPDGLVDVNTADIYELTELPGVGETLAQAILDEREARGPFFYPEDLLSVRGIGEKKLEGFREMLALAE